MAETLKSARINASAIIRKGVRFDITVVLPTIFFLMVVTMFGESASIEERGTDEESDSVVESRTFISSIHLRRQSIVLIFFGANRAF